MAYPHICLTTLFILIGAADCLQIISLDVPNIILNNSRDYVVLDCEYRYEQYEIEGLEVKWFWNSEPEAVYQWIPGKRPEAMGILKGRVNLRHRASKNRNIMYRAVKILNPTTDLTGIFKCRVSSFHDEDSASKRMIVYSPADSMNMTFEKDSKKVVTFYCLATGVFPKPTISLLLLNEGQSRIIKPYHVESSLNSDGGYNISLQARVNDKKLPKEALIQCMLKIPGTNYRIRRQFVYFPDYSFRGFDDGSSCCSGSVSLVVLSLTFLLYSFIPRTHPQPFF